MPATIAITEFADEWRDRAKCLGQDVRKFFPLRGDDEEPGKRVCNGLGDPRARMPACPVRAQCLEYALSNFIKEGIFGGMSERERRGLRQNRYLETGGVERRNPHTPKALKERIKLLRLESLRSQGLVAA
jgi:WhiB family redox-sensing transcriptional regulator